MREKIIKIKKVENGYVLTVFFAGSNKERNLIARTLIDVQAFLVDEFENNNKGEDDAKI